MKLCKKNILTETRVMNNDNNDFIAESCFKENSLSIESTDSRAKPSPPLKYPP